MTIDEVKQYVSQGKLKWSQHCAAQMANRDISTDDVLNCIETGEIIEDYPDDFPYPSCLIFGHAKSNHVIHVVAGSDGEFLYLITAYIPNTVKFEDDLKTRRL